jgi:hypothetical protein
LAWDLSIVVKTVAELNGLGVQVYLASTGLEPGEATVGLSLSALTSFKGQFMQTLKMAVTSKSKSR